MLAQRYNENKVVKRKELKVCGYTVRANDMLIYLIKGIVPKFYGKGEGCGTRQWWVNKTIRGGAVKYRATVYNDGIQTQVGTYTRKADAKHRCLEYMRIEYLKRLEKKIILCEGCGEPLPMEEKKMESYWHFDCWHNQVIKDRENNPDWSFDEY